MRIVNDIRIPKKINQNVIINKKIIIKSKCKYRWTAKIMQSKIQVG